MLVIVNLINFWLFFNIWIEYCNIFYLSYLYCFDFNPQFYYKIIVWRHYVRSNQMWLNPEHQHNQVTNLAPQRPLFLPNSIHPLTRLAFPLRRVVVRLLRPNLHNPKRLNNNLLPNLRNPHKQLIEKLSNSIKGISTQPAIHSSSITKQYVMMLYRNIED